MTGASSSFPEHPHSFPLEESKTREAFKNPAGLHAVLGLRGTDPRLLAAYSRTQILINQRLAIHHTGRPSNKVNKVPYIFGGAQTD